MKRFYGTYRSEILTVVSILTPFMVAYLATTIFTNQTIARLLASWNIYLPTLLLLCVTLYAFVLLRRIRNLKKSGLHEFQSKDSRRYRNVLDLAQSTYFLLGMSAEEFQRSIPLKDYFMERIKSSKPVKEIKFLLLHPDSQHFARRILEVNPGCDIKSLIRRKKEIIRSLYHGLKSLPPGSIGSFEMRFYDSYPIWVIQFFDSRDSSDKELNLDSLVLMMHLQKTHSKYSPQFILRKNHNPVFDSFVSYFQSFWEESLPMQPDGRFPKLYTPESERIELIILDFDGVIVESNELKKESFINSYGPISGKDKKKLLEFYLKNEGLPRDEIYRNAKAAFAQFHFSQTEIPTLLNYYAQYYDAHISQVSLVPGFEHFYEVFKNRFRFAIASNAPQEEIHLILHKLGLAGWFTLVYGQPTTKTEATKSILRTFELAQSNCLFIGDSREDLVVCQALGIDFFARRKRNDHLPIPEDHFFLNYEDLEVKFYTLTQTHTI